jgi:hypothetical protein
MPDFTAKRTLVKSPPELWSELSEAENLARHLGEFGEIRITRVEPETTVAWEGEHASGTVAIEASGWGTKVELTVELPDQPESESEPVPEPVPEAADPEPVAVEEPDEVATSISDFEQRFSAEFGDRAGVVQEIDEDALNRPKKPGFFARLLGRKSAPRTTKPVTTEPVATEPGPVAEAEPAPEPEPILEEPIVIEAAAVAQEPAAIEPETEPDTVGVAPERAQAVLEATLDTLGAAHHRPFSRG